MATRKQKHAAAVAKREAFMAKYREDGLKALEASKKREAEKLEEAKRKVEEANRENKKGVALAKLLTATESRRDKALAEITVGEYLEASNKLMPVFSS